MDEWCIAENKYNKSTKLQKDCEILAELMNTMKELVHQQDSTVIDLSDFIEISKEETEKASEELKTANTIVSHQRSSRVKMSMVLCTLLGVTSIVLKFAK